MAEFNRTDTAAIFHRGKFLKKTGIVNRISPKVYPFAMALLSGYPMGARITGDYYRDG